MKFAVLYEERDTATSPTHKRLNVLEYIQTVISLNVICKMLDYSLILDDSFLPLSYFLHIKENESGPLNPNHKKIKCLNELNDVLEGDELNVSFSLRNDFYLDYSMDIENIPEDQCDYLKLLFIPLFSHLRIADEFPKTSFQILYFALREEDSTINKMYDCMNFPFYLYRLKINLEKDDHIICNNQPFLDYIASEKMHIQQLETENNDVHRCTSKTPDEVGVLSGKDGQLCAFEMCKDVKKMMYISKSSAIKVFSSMQNHHTDYKLLHLVSKIYNIPVKYIH